MADSPAWDLETDFISVGSGVGGLSAAITARDHGLDAIVLEKVGMLGGVTAYSYGEIWIAANHLQREAGIQDSIESGLRYVTWLGAGFIDPERARTYAYSAPAILQYFDRQVGIPFKYIRNFSDYYYPDAADSSREGRFIEVQPFAANQLGEWQDRVRMSPHTPGGVTHEDIFGQGGAANMINWDMTAMAERLQNDERCLGNGLAGWLVKAALDRNVQLLTNTEVVGLITELGAVVGVRAVQGDQTLRIRANRGVLLATSSYDWNAEYVKLFDRHPEFVSALPSSVTGDHLRLAGRLGARIVHVPQVPNLGYHVTGEEHDDGTPLWRLAVTDTGLPHSIVVNKKGRRFADESFYPSLGDAVEIYDASSNEFANYPCWVVVDSQNVNKYPFGSILPGQEFPEEMAVRASTIREVAERAGICPDGLVAEVDRVNRFAADGRDPDFGRGSKPWSHAMCGDPKGSPKNPNLGTLSEPPFYAIPLKPIGGGLCSTGLDTDVNASVLDWDGAPIAGLYAAGNSAAQRDIGSGYQSGLGNGRGLVFGHLAAVHASGKPSQALGRPVDAS